MALYINGTQESEESYYSECGRPDYSEIVELALKKRKMLGQPTGTDARI